MKWAEAKIQGAIAPLVDYWFEVEAWVTQRTSWLT